MRRALVLLAAGALLLASGCRDDHVTLAYHPRRGATFTYDIHVVSSTRTTLPDRGVSTSQPATADLTARQRVLDADGDTTRVQVALTRAGIGERTFVMRFDRAAQLTAVESVEGIPTEVLGTLGLSEIFPASAGAPPNRPLRPGDHWRIDDGVQLAGMATPSRLAGEGRLIGLDVVDGHDTATVESTTTLPLTATTTTTEGVQTLVGTQVTTITVEYDLGDGSVRHSNASTVGTFTLTLAPPPGQAGAPLHGTLTVDLQSEIRRTAA